jgi:hypothetical protein
MEVPTVRPDVDFSFPAPASVHRADGKIYHASGVKAEKRRLLGFVELFGFMTIVATVSDDCPVEGEATYGWDLLAQTPLNDLTIDQRWLSPAGSCRGDAARRFGF